MTQRLVTCMLLTDCASNKTAPLQRRASASKSPDGFPFRVPAPRQMSMRQCIPFLPSCCLIVLIRTHQFAISITTQQPPVQLSFPRWSASKYRMTAGSAGRTSIRIISTCTTSRIGRDWTLTQAIVSIVIRSRNSPRVETPHCCFLRGTVWIGGLPTRCNSDTSADLEIRSTTIPSLENCGPQH